MKKALSWEQALSAHRERGGGTGGRRQPKVVAFLTMVEHYMGSTVPVAVHSDL